MKTIISILLVGAVVVGGYFLINKKEDAVVKSDQATQEQNKDMIPQPEGKKMAFTEFMKSDKGSYECTVNQYVQNIESKGTVFISNGKIRGSFATNVGGTNVDSNLIVKDGFTYVWSSMTGNLGFKSPVVEGEGDTSASASGSYSWNGNQIGDYDCKPWTLDNSKFELPAGVEFKQMSV